MSFQLLLLQSFNIVVFHRSRKKNIAHNFTLCLINFFIHVCYKCVYNMIMIIRFDENILNQTLNRTCHIFLCYCSFYKKHMVWLQIAFRICNAFWQGKMIWLIEIMRWLIFIMNILRSLSVISYMMNFILSTKVSMSKQKICLYSALVSVFCFRFMVLIASCLFLKRRKKLFSHGFPPKFDQYVHSSKDKKEQQVRLVWTRSYDLLWWLKIRTTCF